MKAISKLETVLLYTAFVLAAILALGMLVNAHHGSTTSHTITIVKTIRNVSYHGMTCTETIDSAGNSYMNECVNH